MKNDGIIINGLNKIFAFSQERAKIFYENNIIAKNLDNIIWATILAGFILSMFVSSDIIGVVAFLTFALTILNLFLKKGKKLDINIFEMFLIFYFLVVVISLAGSSLFKLSLHGFLKTATYFGFYVSVVQYFKENIKRIQITLLIIGGCATIQSIIGIFQNFMQVDEISSWQDTTNLNPEDVLTRVYGTLQPYNPNLFGGYFVATLPALFGICMYYFFVKKYYLSGSALSCGLIASVAILMSGCRGAYIGLATILLCFFLFLGKKVWESQQKLLKRIYLSVIGGVAGLSVLAICFISAIRTRIFSIFAMRADSSTSFRLNVYQSVIHMIKDNWLLGIGVGNQNFREIYGLYMRTGFDALSAYNIFLEVFVESGIFALIFFVAFLGTLIYNGICYILKSTNTQTVIIVTTAVISIIAICVHGMFDTIFFRPQLQLIFWTMVAIISAVLKNEKTQA